MADFTEIIQEINTNFPDNNTQSITAAKLRETLIDLTNVIDSAQTSFESDVVDLTKFSTGEDVSSIGIDNTELINPSQDTLPKATDILKVYGDYKENPEYIRLLVDNDGKLLFGIKYDGSIYLGVDVPKLIKDYVNEQITKFADEGNYDEIISFLGNLIEGDTLVSLLDGKVDKIDGESLINSDVAERLYFLNNAEYLYAITDDNGKIIEALKSNGTKKFNTQIDFQGYEINIVDNPQWFKIVLDKENKILYGLTKNGEKVENLSTKFDLFKADNGEVDNLNITNIITLSQSATDKLKEDLDNLPIYWKNYLLTKESDIQLALSNAGNHGDILIYFSDYHFAANVNNTPFIIKYLSDRMNNVKVINCGDILNSQTTVVNSMPVLESFVSSFSGIKLYNVFGNHDFGAANNGQLTINNYYPLLFKQLESDPFAHPTKQEYYYIDNPTQKIRYIVLDTYDHGFNLTDSKTIEQFDWFTSVLNSVEAGWYVVICAHIIFDIYTTSANTHYIGITTSGNYVKSLLDAYQAKSQGTIGIGTTYPYNFTNASGSVACVLFGHIHYDYSEMSEAGYPLIGIEQDAINYPGPMENQLEREAGTYTEQAFDIVSIDTQNKIIKTVRIGAGNNREFTFE